MNAEWVGPRPMTSQAKGHRCGGPNFGGQNKTAPGRGGGPGACLSEALGGIRARRGNGAGFKRACHPLRFWKRKMGSTLSIQKCESRIHSRQKRICRGGTKPFLD